MANVKQCKLCTDECPQAERAHEAAIGRMYATKEFIDLQEKVESGQLVEVVRCKDCEHYNLVSPSSLQDYPYCSVQYECDGTHKEKAKNDFCSYGERRG